MTYTVGNLDTDSIYFIYVRAENTIGLGYQAKQPSFIRTMSGIEQRGDLYVWGCNASAEIGLTDEFVDEHK